MRKPRKLLVLVTALAMVLLVSVPSMAVPGNSISLPECDDIAIATAEVERITPIQEGIECRQDGQICVAFLPQNELPLSLLVLEPELEIVCPPDEEGDGGGGGGGGGGAGGGGGGAAAPLELTQETEQEAESADVNQSFDVSQTGDNSNQCASPQGAANTGNPQNVTDLLQATSEVDDFEFEEVGSDITVSPESTTTCGQQVNQAASASG